jgi:hypothetical protein
MHLYHLLRLADVNCVIEFQEVVDPSLFELVITKYFN